WVDEIASLELSNGHALNWRDYPADQLLQPGPNITSIHEAPPINAIWDVLKKDTHPPLYLLILRYWRTIFGDSDSAARLLSAICALIAIWLLYDSVRLLEGLVPALWAAAIMALATPQIQYSQEIRSYMMMVMWTLAATNAALRIERLKITVPRSMALALSLLGGLLTHYYAVAGAAAIAMYATIHLRGHQKRAMLAAIGGAMVLFIVACGPLLWSQRPNFHDNMNWIADVRQGLPGRTLWRILSLPLTQLMSPMRRAMPLAPVSAAFLVLPLLTFRRKPSLMIWWLLAVATIALSAAADLINGSRSLEYVRYTLAAAPAIFAIGAITLSDRHGWLRHVIPATMVIGCLIGLNDAYIQPLKVDYRAFAHELDRQAGPRDILAVYYTGDEDWYERAMYAGLMHYLPQSNRPLLIVTKPVDQALQLRLHDVPNVWLLGQTSPPVERFFPGAFSDQSIDMPFVGTAVTVRWPVAPTTARAHAPETAP
ncbi:MAG TPA: glycosyltransferase family 39 protein, partial [Tepidisphaeraceae bacterium]|nr:glycosyltransferase family 39 protein [Tepidisphaeraceae bacterium]